MGERAGLRLRLLTLARKTLALRSPRCAYTRGMISRAVSALWLHLLLITLGLFALGKILAMASRH